MTEIIELKKKGIYLRRKFLEQLGLKTGDRVIIEVKPKSVEVVPLTHNQATLKLLERLSLPAGALKNKAENPDARIDLQDEIGGDIYDESID